MKLVFTFLLVLFCNCLLAQEKEVFLNINRDTVNASAASYYCKIFENDSIKKETCYYTGSKTLASKAQYNKIPNITSYYNTAYKTYFPNGNVSTIDTFYNGYRIYKSYHYNGVLKDSVFRIYYYTIDANSLREDKVGIREWKWYSNGSIEDSTYNFNDTVLVYRSWHDNAMPGSAGYLDVNFKKISKWKYYHSNGNISAIIDYKKDKIINAMHYDINGKLLPDTLLANKPASFKKKKNAWSNYVDNNLYWPKGYKIINGDTATVVVNYTISNTGKVEDVYIAVPFNPAFDEIVVNLVKSSPRWSPRIECNRAIKETKSQTVTFSNKPK